MPTVIIISSLASYRPRHLIIIVNYKRISFTTNCMIWNFKKDSEDWKKGKDILPPQNLNDFGPKNGSRKMLIKLSVLKVCLYTIVVIVIVVQRNEQNKAESKSLWFNLTLKHTKIRILLSRNMGLGSYLIGLLNYRIYLHNGLKCQKRRFLRVFLYIICFVLLDVCLFVCLALLLLFFRWEVISLWNILQKGKTNNIISNKTTTAKT